MSSTSESDVRHVVLSQATVLAGVVRLGLGGAVGAVLGLLSAQVVAPTYQSETGLQLGVAANAPLENATQLASLLESEGYRQRMSQVLGFTIGRRGLSSEAVDAAESGASSYLRVVARAASAGEVQALLAAVTDDVVKRHARLHEEATASLRNYQGGLATTLTNLDANIDELQRTLSSNVQQPRGDAVATALLQSNLVGARTQRSTLARDLRDQQLQFALSTRPTQPVGPPSGSADRVWPNTPVFVAVGLVTGVLLAAAALFLL